MARRITRLWLEFIILNYYKQLITLRKEKDVFVNGKFRLFMDEHESIFAYERLGEEEMLLIICNFSDESVEFIMPDQWQGNQALLLSNYSDNSGCLRPYEAKIYIKKAGK